MLGRLIVALAEAVGFRSPIGERVYTDEEHDVFWTFERDTLLLRSYRQHDVYEIESIRLNSEADPASVAQALSEEYEDYHYDRP